jgi:peroxiredoxin (alkyl hydroperoxide reductase subunit C)
MKPRMRMATRAALSALALVLFLGLFPGLAAPARAEHGTSLPEEVYPGRARKPVDSQLAVAVGQEAPDFTLPGISGESVTLSRFRGEKNVLISFVPAAWTPVCSDQWPGYDLARPLFEKHDTMVLGISVDNTPTQYAWVAAMNGLWFPVLSDFWPHGATASAYGVLRTDGMAERALILIDKRGVIRFIDVHDINERPDLGDIARELEKLP